MLSSFHHYQNMEKPQIPASILDLAAQIMQSAVSSKFQKLLIVHQANIIWKLMNQLNRAHP